MKASLRALAALALLATAACNSTRAGPPPPAPPSILSFSADKSSVNAGESVKLSFKTSDAKDVSLIDQSGLEIPVSGTVADGAAMVTPTKTSFYVLRVTGEGGKDSAFVQVAVNEGLKQVFLIAVPTEVSSGEPVELVWSALGGTNVTVKDSAGMTLASTESGTQTVQPEKTSTYTLRADGPTGMLTATARVTVRPTIKEFSASPAAARQGQKIKLAWRTAGADGVVVKENTFGELVRTTTDVAMGSYEFTVPTELGQSPDGGTLPDGGVFVSRPTPDNYPLHFTLTATSNSPVQVVSAALDSVVRDGPIINSFDVPSAVSENKPLTLVWDVSAYRVQVLLDGVPVFNSVPPAIASGSLTLPGLGAQTEITLVAYDYLGLKATSSKVVTVVKPPKVSTFTLPMTITTAGSSASAAWTTMNATLLVLRIKNGPAVFTTQTAVQVNAGTATVNPADTTTYVLEAYNAAGDVDALEKTVTVQTPATTSATPNPTAPNTPVLLSWDVSGLNPTEVIGIPSELVNVTANSPAFVDLELLPLANKVYFANRADGVATFTVPNGYRFPFITNSVGKFTVGVNGFLALAPTTGSTLINNVDFKAATGLPNVPLIAPFWDNLDLGSAGDVFWSLEGTAFPRRLIVQWNKVNAGSDTSSDLTFQVQLFETGEVRFIYKTLQDAASQFAQGQSATVGIFAGVGLFAGQHSFNAATLAPGQELTWFTQGLATGTSTIKVGNTNLSPGFFYKTAGGGYVYVSIPVRVFGPNSVKVNEAMPVADPGTAMGQYVELYNPSTEALDVSGLQLLANVTPVPGYVLPAGTLIPAKGFLVVGQSVDAAQNGDALVTLAYGSDVVLTPATDAVRLVIPGATPFEISKLSWATTVPGESVQSEVVLGTVTCTRTMKYGTTVMQLGTPGKVNESCFDYTADPIPVSFTDISTSASVLVTGDATLGTLDITAAPFTYFKTPFTTLKASTNGFITFGTTNTSAADSNRIAPSTTTTSAKGSLAILWDDLDSSDTQQNSNVYSKRMAQGADPANPAPHWIIQWSHYTHYGFPIPTIEDDFNFQVKLFDAGTIEFHYGTMFSSPTVLCTGVPCDYGSGTGATVWIEMLTGAAALPISIDKPGISSNTAYRFTPRP